MWVCGRVSIRRRCGAYRHATCRSRSPVRDAAGASQSPSRGYIPLIHSSTVPQVSNSSDHLNSPSSSIYHLSPANPSSNKIKIKHQQLSQLSHHSALFLSKFRKWPTQTCRALFFQTRPSMALGSSPSTVWTSAMLFRSRSYLPS